MHEATMNSHKIIFLSMLASAITLTYCATNPVTGKKQIVLMSEQQELAMGKEADPSIISEFGLYPDSNLQRFIREKGNEMARISHRNNIQYHFRVLDSDVINAFAVPGGYVYFTRGILAHMNDEAQFAGVLGHEIGHVTARHTVSQQTTQTLAQLGLIAALISNKYLAQFAEPASQGLQLMFLKNSRDAEKQADELGVEYSSKVGYDAREMAKFFQTLERETAAKSNSRLPEFLSTHPDPGNRFVTVTKLASNYQAKNNLNNLKINRDNYLRMVDGVVYGEDPRQGFKQNDIFYHPQLRFQFNTPPGWQYKNSPTVVNFAQADGQAMALLTLAKGNSLEEAAQQFAQQNKLRINENRRITVNGINALAQQADVQGQDQSGRVVTSVRVISYFIQYNGTIYKLVGASTPQLFEQFAPKFALYFGSFKQLTDPAILNIKPERIAIKKIAKAFTLQLALTSLGVPQARLNEHAILNGMQLTDQLQAGTLVKVAERK
jgi:predicted Zn-dependent protease